MPSKKLRIPGKSAVMAMTAVILIFTLAGCGASDNLGGNGSPSGKGSNRLPSGNWSIVGTSTVTSGHVYTLGGNITQNGSTLSGRMHVLGPCEDPKARDRDISVALTGLVNLNQFTFTLGPTIAGSVVTVVLAGNGPSLNELTGTYTVTGGCSISDEGTMTATLVPPFYGPWVGNGVPISGNPDVMISLALYQPGTANQFGTYAVTGSLNYSSSGCTASAVPIVGWVAGSIVSLTTKQADINPIAFTFSGSLVPPFNSILAGDYQTFESGTPPGCAGDNGTIDLEYEF
jgi:hypothetical protein